MNTYIHTCPLYNYAVDVHLRVCLHTPKYMHPDIHTYNIPVQFYDYADDVHPRGYAYNELTNLLLNQICF